MPRLRSALRAHRVWVATAAVAVCAAAALVRDAIHVTGQVTGGDWACVVVSVAAGVVALWALLSLGMEHRHHGHP
jgi:predicted lysophospholipase L1 biosynthesis ABC-type transport system permease subunit